MKLGCAYEVCWMLVCGSDEFIHLVESSRLELQKAVLDSNIKVRILAKKGSSMQVGGRSHRPNLAK